MGERSQADRALAAAQIASILSDITGTDVIPVDGGFRLRETETHFVDVMRNLVNWRVTMTIKAVPGEYDRWWCFAGRGFPTLVEVAGVVTAWDCADDTEPEGWVKNGQTGEIRRTHGK